jgi:VWFA-related protein
MKVFAILLTVLLLSAALSGDSLVYVRVHQDLIEQQLKLSPTTAADRVRLLHALFEKGGCRQVAQQAVPDEELPNLICILPGQENGTILVSTALEVEGESAAARWNTLTMLPLLAESISPVAHRYTVMIAAFAGRSHDNRGAQWYVEHLTDAQRSSLKAAVDLDDLGRTSPVYALAQTDRALTAWADVASLSLHLAMPPQVDAHLAAGSHSNLPTVADAAPWNSVQPFAKAHVPVVAWRSAPPEMVPALQSRGLIEAKPNGAEPDLAVYQDTYRLLCVYVLYLDHNLGRPLAEVGTYTGKIVDTEKLFGSGPVDTTVIVDRFTNLAELSHLESISQAKGQEGLSEAVNELPDLAVLRLGTQLATGVKLAVLQRTTKDNPYMLFVAPRAKGSGDRLIAAPRGKRGAEITQDFRFTVIRLDLNEKGEGDGQFYSTARLRFRNHELEVEDYGSKPELIRQVRLEPPPVAPATEVAPRAVASAAAGSGVAAGAGTSTAARATPAAKADATQAASAESAPAPTFRAQARLVQVDVTVTDSKGAPITGLTASDFIVAEDDKPQPIRAFEVHVPPATSAPAAVTAAASLPPHTYTNRIEAPTDDTLNVLLFDLLNTPTTDQAYARKQMIDFLKTLPPGKRLAMFVLAGHLVQVQDFTGDSSALVASAEKILNQRSLLLTPEAERQQFQGATDAVGRFAAPAAGSLNGAPVGALSNVASGGDIDFGSAQARQRSNAMTEADRLSQRINFTLDSLTALARAVAGYPGRKNLIWLSGTFPIRLKPGGIDTMRLNSANHSESTGLISTPDFQPQVRATATMLAAARVAVYPMDIRGVQTAGVDITVGSTESAVFTGTDNPEAYTENLNTQSETRFQERSSIQEVAEQTGGQVLVGNDIKDGIARGLASGSTYYTLAYAPVREDSDPGFRRVLVKVQRKGVRLSYRPGYFPTTGLPSPSVHPLIVALQPGMLPATLIPMTVELLPPAGTGTKAQVHYTIDANSLTFNESPEHLHRAFLDCLAVAFKKDGSPIGQASNSLQVGLNAAQYQDALRSGLQYRQELDLPAGDYDVRIGVMDRSTQKIGTLAAPLAVAAAVK